MERGIPGWGKPCFGRGSGSAVSAMSTRVVGGVDWRPPWTLCWLELLVSRDLPYPESLSVDDLGEDCSSAIALDVNYDDVSPTHDRKSNYFLTRCGTTLAVTSGRSEFVLVVEIPATRRDLSTRRREACVLWTLRARAVLMPRR